MTLTEVLIFLSGVGLVALYARFRMYQREIAEAREALFEANTKRTKEIEEQVKKLEESVVKKEGEHAKNIIEFNRKYGSDGSDDSNGSGKQ
jgi:cell division protein FtsB